MKYKRTVIPITCSVGFLALCLAGFWVKVNGEFLSMDRSGRTLSAAETMRFFFSDDTKDGVKFVSVKFPKKPDTGSVSRLEAVKFLRRPSLEFEPILWAQIDGVGQLGIFLEHGSGEVTVYRQNDGFVFVALNDQKPNFEIHKFSNDVTHSREKFTVLPDSVKFTDWKFQRDEVIENLDRFSRCRHLKSSDQIEAVAFFCGRINQGENGQNDDYLIHYDSSSQSWQVKNWPRGRLLSEWRAFLAEEAENRLDK